MTEAEKELLDLVLRGTSASGEALRVARDAVLIERLPRDIKAKWQMLYANCVRARRALDDFGSENGLDDLNLSPWKRETERNAP